ncbi:hypothetical protein [Flavobacterium sp.]|uniref:hypothetical protein n=1 Tax=Flavobacterium sp. TaxID=239 RepID=UPI0028BF3EE6|nr:hypothetical protein [Flavobacterium sp.]
MKLKHYFFSLLLVYYFLHIFGFIFGFVFEPLVYFIGEHIFKIDYTFEVNGYGSGDNTYSYLASFCNLLAAFVVAFPVTFLLNKAKNIQVIQNYFFVLLRMYLIFFMLIYGLSKIYPMQFPPIGLQRLEQTYGDSSPMGLAWSFMQYSQTYTAFAGITEVLGALLLLSRRTMTLGALVLTGVLTNIVMMNFCYDIPVKLSSSHMLLAALILLLSDYKRFINFFVLNKEIKAKIHHNGFENGEEPKAFFLGKVVLKAFFAVGITTYFTIQYFSYKDEMEKKPLLYGIYEVVPSEENTATYRSFIFDRYDTGVITDTNYKKNIYSYKVDTKTKTVTFDGSQDTTAVKQVFKYQKTKDELILTTTSAKKIHLKEKKGEAILLTYRGFNWINEYPYNR